MLMGVSENYLLLKKISEVKYNSLKFMIIYSKAEIIWFCNNNIHKYSADLIITN